jgi:anti-anti-sigma factor
VLFSIDSRRLNDKVMLVVAGEIDTLTAPDLDAELATAALATDVSGVLVDLSAVAFADSSGINSLLKGMRLANANGKTYGVVSTPERVRHLLELTGVWEFLRDDARN